MRPVVRRDRDAVGDNVVDVVSTHRTEVPDISNLNWRSSQRENAGAGMLGVAAEIDSDVDPLCARQRCHRMVGHDPHVDELVETGRDPRRHRVPGVRAERETDGVEARTIVILEQADHQLRYRMLPEIR